MSITETLQVRVKSVTWEADGILSFELCPMPPRKELPPFTAGAHVDLHLPNGTIRSYSLLNSQDERHRYVIGVNKDAQSRGGSRYMHETLRAGDTLAISAPRNNFTLDETAPQLGVHRRRHRHHAADEHDRAPAPLGQPWQSALRGAHAPERGLRRRAAGAARRRTAPNVHFTSTRSRGRMLDIPGIVAALPAGAHLYCCGPLPMLDAFEQAAEGAAARARARRVLRRARECGGHRRRLHRGAGAHQAHVGDRARPHHPRLPEEIGIEPPYSCREGICGTCEMRGARRRARPPRPRAQRGREGREQANDDLLLRREEPASWYWTCAQPELQDMTHEHEFVTYRLDGRDRGDRAEPARQAQRDQRGRDRRSCVTPCCAPTTKPTSACCTVTASTSAPASISPRRWPARRSRRSRRARASAIRGTRCSTSSRAAPCPASQRCTARWSAAGSSWRLRSARARRRRDRLLRPAGRPARHLRRRRRHRAHPARRRLHRDGRHDAHGPAAVGRRGRARAHRALRRARRPGARQGDGAGRDASRRTRTTRTGASPTCCRASTTCRTTTGCSSNT